jgi:hypothetical protein
LGVYGLSYAVYPPSPAMDEYLAAVACPPAAAENGGLSRFLWPGTTRSVVGTRMGLSPSALQSEDRVLCDLAPFDQPGLRNGNEMLLRGWSRADGYAGLEPQRTRDFRNLAALQVAGVRWVRRGPETQQIAGLTPRDEDWLEVPDPLPRVRLTAKPAAEPQTYTAPGWARLMADRPGRIEVALQSAGPQTLVIAESHHPGWQVAVDGRPRPLLCAEGGFLGCAMGPDDRTVVFTFRPQSLRRGWFNTLLGLGLLGGWMLAALGRPARRRPPPTDAANACRKESKR